MVDTGTQALLDNLRRLCADCVSKHQLSTARFYADKVCILSDYSHADVSVLAEIYFLHKEYQRSVALMQKHELIPYPSHMGVYDVSFQSDSLLVIGGGDENTSKQPPAAQAQAPSSPIMATITKPQRLQYLLLGTQCLFECGEYESCLSMLSNSDESALQYVQPDILCTRSSDANLDGEEITYSSLLCLIRGKALEKLCLDQRALWWFERALVFDCKNIQAFDCIIKRRLCTLAKLQTFLDKELHFQSHQHWIRLYYECKLNEMASRVESLQRMQDILDTTTPNHQQQPQPTNTSNIATRMLSQSNDLKMIQANCLLNLNQFRESYLLSIEIKLNDAFHLDALVAYIISLVELGKQSELYKVAHDLICTYPDLAIAWFSVGCYYYMTRRYELSRRFLHKATCLDKFFYAAWIVYAHTFSEQDADDQAMASYRTVSRFFPHSYQPLLFQGMAYLNMNNYAYAEKFMKEAYKLFDADPMVYNELGVVYYQQKQYEKAKDFFNTTLKYISADCYNQWESTFVNLGHCYRKMQQYEEAIKCYIKARNISPKDPMILSSIAFTYHLQNKIDQAILFYHKVLALHPHDTFCQELCHRALQTATNNLVIS